MKTLLSSFRAP